MQSVDYPKVKDEVIELHKTGKSLEEINDILNAKNDFIVDGVKVDTLPVFREVIYQYQQ